MIYTLLCYLTLLIHLSIPGYNFYVYASEKGNDNQECSIQKNKLDIVRKEAIEKIFENCLREISSTNNNDKPSCFISHAWGRNDIEKSRDDVFVKRLKSHLDFAGIVTYYGGRTDERGIKGGTSLPQFMDKMSKTEYVLAVYTPAFKEKYDKRTGVATEIDYVVHTANDFSKQEKLVPVLLYGNSHSSIPSLLSVIADCIFNYP